MTEINILDIDPTLGNGADATDAINTFLDDARAVPQYQAQLGKSLYIPNGLYTISSTIREGTQTGALRIRGESQWGTIVRASEVFTGAEMLHIGLDDGHGCYRANLSNFALQGFSKTQDLVGLRADQAGLSTFSALNFKNLGTCAINNGGCSVTFENKCQFENSIRGVRMYRYADISSNGSILEQAWFSNIDRSALAVCDSGLVSVRNNTFQSATIGGGNYHAIEFVIPHEGGFSGYGDGPVVEDNWMEGGSYAYAMYFNTANRAKVRNNHIWGSSSADGTKEGGIFFRTSPNRHEENNVVYGTFNRTPTGGRTANYARYADSASPAAVNSGNYYTSATYQG